MDKVDGRAGDAEVNRERPVAKACASNIAPATTASWWGIPGVPGMRLINIEVTFCAAFGRTLGSSGPATSAVQRHFVPVARGSSRQRSSPTDKLVFMLWSTKRCLGGLAVKAPVFVMSLYYFSENTQCTDEAHGLEFSAT